MEFEVVPPVPSPGVTVVGPAAALAALCDLRLWVDAGAEVHVAVALPSGWRAGQLTFAGSNAKLDGRVVPSLTALRYLGGVAEHLIDAEVARVRSRASAAPSGDRDRLQALLLAASGGLGDDQQARDHVRRQLEQRGVLPRQRAGDPAAGWAMLAATLTDDGARPAADLSCAPGEQGASPSSDGGASSTGAESSPGHGAYDSSSHIGADSFGGGSDGC